MRPKMFYSTKAKREAAAARLSELAARIGIDCETEAHPFNPRELWVKLSFGPYRCNTDLDGATNVGAYLAHWHTDSFSNARYPETFGLNIGGDVNPYHFRKATTFANDFGELLRYIEDGFGRLQFIAKEAA